MSGFASSITLSASAFRVPADPQWSDIEHIETEPLPQGEEAAGKVGSILGIVAAVFIPFAAPALFSAIAGSGVLGAGLASAVAAGTVGTMTSVIGSAVVGGILNAGAAYLGGARGGEVWQAAGMGALSAGGRAFATAGGLARAGSAASGVSQTGSVVGGATNAAGATVPGMLSGSAHAGMTGAASVGVGGISATNSLVAGAGGVSDTILNGIRSVVGNVSGQTLNRLGAAVINAAVNGQSMGELDAVVEQQRAELAALAASDQAVYNQKISEAQKILSDADKMDPAWRGRIAMADVAGMEANQHSQAMRNIATRQGGSLDSGQRKAYQRGAALHTARSKALAYNRGYSEAEVARNQLRNAGAQLMGPNDGAMRAWQADTELEAGHQRGRQQLRQSTWGGVAAGLFEPDYAPATSPDPSAEQEDDDGYSGVFGSNGMFGGSWGRNG
jgi:hypothetical protein